MDIICIVNTESRKKLSDFIQELLENEKKGTLGAITTFNGVVRDKTSEGQDITYMDIECDKDMAEKYFNRLISELKSKYPEIITTGVQHVYGRLSPGEEILHVVVVSSHRKEAFLAVAEFMDRMKREAPIWKKEIWADGEKWVENPETGDIHG